MANIKLSFCLKWLCLLLDCVTLAKIIAENPHLLAHKLYLKNGIPSGSVDNTLLSRHRRSLQDKLQVNITQLPDKNHNEAIVQWSGIDRSVRK